MSCASENCNGSKVKTEELSLRVLGSDEYLEPLPVDFISIVGVPSVSAPPGGYGGRFYHIKGYHDVLVPGDKFLDVVVELSKRLSLDGVFEGWDQVAEIMKSSYATRPGYIGGKVGVYGIKEKTKRLIDREFKGRGPDVWGSSGWGLWHWSVLMWKKGKTSAFVTTSGLLLDLLSDNSPITSCDVCYKHFLNFLTKHPIKDVDTQVKAALYTVAAHNKANEARGIGLMTFEQASYKYGWDFVKDGYDAGELGEDLLLATDYILT